MKTYELAVVGRSIRVNDGETTLVRTSVGMDEVRILFDNAEWLDFPMTVTFAQGDRVVTQSLVVTEVDGSDEWVAEATVTVPYEVVEANGPIRVTLQGTDSAGRHIITAAGSPLSVREAGDVVAGEPPADAPTIDQWTQAYAEAMSAVNRAASIIENLEGRLSSMVDAAQSSLDEKLAGAMEPATYSSLGVIIVGDGLDVTEAGLLSVETDRLTEVQIRRLKTLAALAQMAFGVSADDADTVESAVASPDVLPVGGETAGILRPDGTTITFDEDGTIHGTEQTPLATEGRAGKVKPDGTTITIDEDGTIHGTETYETMGRETIVRLTPFGDIIPTGDGRQY